MSFSYNIKKELCALITDKDRRYACLYGILLFAKSFSVGKIDLITENELVSGLFRSLAGSLVKSEETVKVTASRKKNGAFKYSAVVVGKESREKLMRIFRRNEAENQGINPELIDNNSVFAFLTGAFLSCGSVTDPEKEYHMEFTAPTEILASDLAGIIRSFGINAGIIGRKGRFEVYIKGSEDIEDMLTLMGASMSAIEIMNAKIYKDVRNRANRIANCDSANIERAVRASKKQIDDIKYIFKTAGLDCLPDDLADAARKRLDFPEMTLKELGETFKKPVGRSGVNHRLMKISAIARELRMMKE
jgi:DNA-binding protein WhiA